MSALQIAIMVVLALVFAPVILCMISRYYTAPVHHQRGRRIGLKLREALGPLAADMQVTNRYSFKSRVHISKLELHIRLNVADDARALLSDLLTICRRKIRTCLEGTSPKDRVDCVMDDQLPWLVVTPYGPINLMIYGLTEMETIGFLSEFPCPNPHVKLNIRPQT